MSSSFRISWPLIASVALISACEKPPAVSSTAVGGTSSAADDELSVKPEAEPEPAAASNASQQEAEQSQAADGGELGQLKIRFEYGGDAFEPEKVKITKDEAFCGKKELRNEKLLVHPENKGIQNVVVYVYTGRGGTKLDDFPESSETIELANEFCRFEPRIVITRPGDTLRVTNPDDVGHNANISFFNNPGVNLMIPPKQYKDVPVEQTEPAPIPVDCNIHPWMRGYVLVLEHPFAAVSDENGELTIQGLPVGNKLMFRVYHEAGAINEVTVAGKKADWKRSRFEVDIQAGRNDLGTVVIPAGALTVD